MSTKILELRKKLSAYSVDYFLIPSNDEFQNEYVPEHLNRLKYISGFSGSNGIALIGEQDNLFFTDGRYLLQAEQEVSDNFTILDINNILKYIPKSKIGYDPKLHTKSFITKFKDYNFVPCVDFIETEKNTQKSKTFIYSIKYSGESFLDKKEKILSYIQEKELDALIMTDSANICWLLNVRAYDVLYNLILLSNLIFYKDGRLELFSNADDVENVQCYPLSQLNEKINIIKNHKVQIDPSSASIALTNLLNNYIEAPDPCFLLKAYKNRIEISQAKKTHVHDGVAVTKLLFWLEKNYQDKTELDIVEKLLEFRSLNKNFICPSFATIAAFRENGAIIHYSPNELTNKKIQDNGLLLIDSGGHYFGGTTDVTRTISIGRPTYQQKFDFTLVLKALIACSICKFPKGTKASYIDTLARGHLWKYYKDYAHATGHGVGNCLSVHESPPRINKTSSDVLAPGMIIACEPGFYKENEYGIRIENLLLVKAINDEYLGFDTLTLVPIDYKLVLLKLLSSEERKWLFDYNKMVYRKLNLC